MEGTRRRVLKGLGAGLGLVPLLAAGLLKPVLAWATQWNAAGFEGKDLAAALKGAGVAGDTASDKLTITAPDIAENGAVVPVKAESAIPNTSQILVFVEQNPSPLAASFEFLAGAVPAVEVRVKMAKTSAIRVVAKADGKFFSASKEVKVTVGGCGG
jgi:sulfur-oxidizing protein SoxY